MEEIWTKAFSRSYDTLSVNDRIVIDGVLDELLERHGSADMRHSLMNVANEKIWATRRIQLNADLVRITWMYEETTDSIVMLTVASVESE
ncbi:MAG: hypothetical protein L0Z63_03990 [Actinobacteria bacterium]|nr:hypothetical protein [Actinomycetota bacterium]